VDGGTGFWSCLLSAGRRPEGFDAPDRIASDDVIGTYLAAAAQLEAASVAAFRILRRELGCHGAPRRLLRRASRAARDERRHARRIGALARRWGAEVRAPKVDPSGTRPLADVALENAAEGCVRETFGALVAAWQATHAGDAGVRAAMQDVAREETRHAALAWEVARWAERRLPRIERKRVADAGARALLRLKAEAGVEPPQELVDTLGVPTANQATRLLDGMVRALRMETAVHQRA
jgi:rubrerythrin